MKEKNKRKYYSNEFKLEAVKLVAQSEKRVEEIAIDLGVVPNTLYHWLKKYEDKAGAEDTFKSSSPDSKDIEIRKLKRDLEIERRKVQIIKKAMAIFSQGARRN